MTFKSLRPGGKSGPSYVCRVLPTGNMKGAHVRNFAGEDFGKVDEFVVDFESGRIAATSWSPLGGFLGIGDKLFAVPWDLFSTRTDDHEFFLDVEKQMLLDALRVRR